MVTTARHNLVVSLEPHQPLWLMIEDKIAVAINVAAMHFSDAYR